MKGNLPNREPEFVERWMKQGLYQRIQSSRSGKPLYVLHDGPPYANGHIHIGHALNKILKDIIVKSRTMEGMQSPYVPGWDCHGLPIEHQVTKQLGEKKKDMSATELRRQCREYADKFWNIQRDEFQRLGVLGDWDHPYLTMDKAYEATIIREFGKFVEQGGVYKGLKPVLWCTQDQTALAEAEVEYMDHASPSIFVKFPFDAPSRERLGLDGLEGVEKVSIVIWTTTPWTLPANQAIAMHPEIEYAFVRVGDEVLVMAEKLVEEVSKACELKAPEILARKKGHDGFEALRCQRPLSKGLSPIVLGDFVTLEQGTGCVHIAPGHGMDDYLLALKYNARTSEGMLPEPLQILVPVDDYGRFTNEVEEFAGQHVFKADPAIVEKLRQLDVLLGDGKLTHSYPHCWRCKKPVIFRATQQWFVSMDKGRLRERALEEIDRVQWIPERGRERIYGMIENRPDWCLSRQRIWGTPIPGFTCAQCQTPLINPQIIERIAGLVSEHGSDVWFERPARELLPDGTACATCGSTEFNKEQDILDVWLESGVSHAAVVKQQGEDWWPASLYLEGSDQHRGWFHSALLSSVTTDGRAPYRAVLTHGFVVDGQGKKMSKSAGNVVAPQDVIKQHGAEILRLWVAAQDYQEDLRISSQILKQLVEAYRKIRNTCRYLLSNVYDFDPHNPAHQVEISRLPELDRWALLRFNNLIRRVRKGYEEFDFRQIVHELDYFCSVDMSATYLDILKDRLYTFPSGLTPATGIANGPVSHRHGIGPAHGPHPELYCGRRVGRRAGQSNVSGEDSVHLSTFPEPVALPDEGRTGSQMETIAGHPHRGPFGIGTTAARKSHRVFAGSSRGAERGSGLARFLQAYEKSCRRCLSCPRWSSVPPNDPSGEIHLESDEALGMSVNVVKAEGEKCERCWNYRASVGSAPEHPTLCDRCIEAVT